MRRLGFLGVLGLLACAPPEPTGLRRSDPGTGARVRFDTTAQPFPDIPFPIDVATRYDPSSPTGLRVNASMVASSKWEEATRASLDQLDGWGTFAPITVSFDAPLDVEPIFARHRDDFDFSDDLVYLIDLSPNSPDFCQAVPLDMGKGDFPLYLERPSYYPNDPRNGTNQLVFEEVEEDLNHNGRLDPGEDTDMDGVLDHPNLRTPGSDPETDLLTLYERQSNTLILRPLIPLREETTYAVVLTRGLVDQTGRPVRSPFEYINHTQQTPALQPLPACLAGYGRTLDDVAFTWTFTTQSITRDFVSIRDGLAGIGPNAWLQQQFPAELTKIPDLKSPVPGGSFVNLKVVKEEELDQMVAQILQLAGMGGATDPTTQAILESRKFVGTIVMGQFISPQFFPRAADVADTDTPAKWLPLYEQTWKVDTVHGRPCANAQDTDCTYVRPEVITFWINIPKPEYSQRPAPVAILGHGYTGNKIDPLLYGGFFARQGVATLGMECVSHGWGLPNVTEQLATGIFNGYGLEPMATALLTDRAYVQDNNPDKTKSSGADFWTAYVFHTRDVVRQSAVDYIRMVQILKSFDGVAHWKWDMDGSGKPGIAGDWDGDGVVDVGGSAAITMTGGSLGGVMSTLIGGLEPQVPTVVPVSGGGGLADVGIRSQQGFISDAVNLRALGPLVLTQPVADGGTAIELWEYVPDLNRTGAVDLGSIADPLDPGDTAVLRNLNSGTWGCGRVQAGQALRVAVSSDQGDPLQLEIYPGALPPSAQTGGCAVPPGATPRTVINTLGVDTSFQFQKFGTGTPLIAFGDGFGIRRGTPDMRRFNEIAQIALDPGDPVNYAPYFERRLLQYGTGEQVRTRALAINSIGDMIVPMSTGAELARAAGFIDFTGKDPRYNKTDNQVLIDTWSLEASERAGHYVNPPSSATPGSVLMDLENLSSIAGTTCATAANANGSDCWDVPRLNPPLRLVGPDPIVGGTTGVIFPMSTPQGQHGINLPNATLPFDPGAFLANGIARYAATQGMEFGFDACQVSSSCAWIPPVPPN